MDLIAAQFSCDYYINEKFWRPRAGGSPPPPTKKQLATVVIESFWLDLQRVCVILISR